LVGSAEGAGLQGGQVVDALVPAPARDRVGGGVGVGVRGGHDAGLGLWGGGGGVGGAGQSEGGSGDDAGGGDREDEEAAMVVFIF